MSRLSPLLILKRFSSSIMEDWNWILDTQKLNNGEGGFICSFLTTYFWLWIYFVAVYEFCYKYVFPYPRGPPSPPSSSPTSCTLMKFTLNIQQLVDKFVLKIMSFCFI